MPPQKRKTPSRRVLKKSRSKRGSKQNSRSKRGSKQKSRSKRGSKQKSRPKRGSKQKSRSKRGSSNIYYGKHGEDEVKEEVPNVELYPFSAIPSIPDFVQYEELSSNFCKGYLPRYESQMKERKKNPVRYDAERLAIFNSQSDEILKDIDRERDQMVRAIENIEKERNKQLALAAERLQLAEVERDKKLTAKLNAAHQQEVAELRKGFEAKIAELRKGFVKSEEAKQTALAEKRQKRIEVANQLDVAEREKQLALIERKKQQDLAEAKRREQQALAGKREQQDEAKRREQSKIAKLEDCRRKREDSDQKVEVKVKEYNKKMGEKKQEIYKITRNKNTLTKDEQSNVLRLMQEIQEREEMIKNFGLEEAKRLSGLGC